MSPQRIQLSRRKGWRMPEGAVKVDRTTQWGNPFRVERARTRGWKVVGNGTASWSADDKPWTKAEAAQFAVDEFRRTCRAGSIRAREIQIHLGGKDLACWCRVSDACHGDVLLEIANPTADTA